jgi:hypothetical protein
MGNYRVDRERLKAYPTEEIFRILKNDRDDYTDEAIRMFEEILAERGVASDPVGTRAEIAPQTSSASFGIGPVKGPADAVRILNKLLDDVISGKIDPASAQAATNIIMALLQALEQEAVQEEDYQPQ